MAVLNFLVLQKKKKKEDRGVTSLPAERPIRQEERGREDAPLRGRTLLQPQSRLAARRESSQGHKTTRQPGQLCRERERQTDSHNAAPPANPGADVTVHTESREEAADTTTTSSPAFASPRLRVRGRSGRSVGLSGGGRGRGRVGGWGTCPR